MARKSAKRGKVHVKLGSIVVVFGQVKLGSIVVVFGSGCKLLSG